MTPQHDLEAEESALGAMMLSPRAVIDCVDRGLRPEHFYRPSHGTIYRAILSLDEKGEKPDSITVTAKLREWGKLEEVGGFPAVATLAQAVATTTNAGNYAQIVLDVAAERNIQVAATRLQELAAGAGTAAEKMAEAERIIAEATDAGIASEYGRVGEQMSAAFAEVERAYTTGEERVGLKSGFTELDRLTHGFFPGQLVVLAARPAMGKSTLAQNISEWVAVKGKSVCIFSLEMGADEIGLRMLASQSKVEHDKITRGQMSAHEWEQVKQAHKRVGELPIYTVDGTVNVTELRARARRLQRSEGLDLLVVDYLQLLAGPVEAKRNSDSRQVEISDISRSLKLLGRELGIPVLALSQLNRGVEMRPNKRPMLADLRDSGAIEQDADVVAFIYRDEFYDPDSEDKGLAEVIVAKQRSGSTGSFKLRFLGERCKFSNLGGRSRFEGTVEPVPPETTEPTTDDIPF